MARGKAAARLGWSGDFQFRWVPAVECEVVTAEYDHYRCVFGRADASRPPDGVSLYEVIIQSAPWAVAALAAGKEATSWHRVVAVRKLGKPYRPLQWDSPLFLRLADVGAELRKTADPKDREAHVLRWVQSYGILGLWHGVVAPQVLGNGEAVAMPAVEPVEFFVDEAVRMAFLVDLYHALLALDVHRLKEWFSWRSVKGRVQLEVEGDPLFLVNGPPQVPVVRPKPPAGDKEWILLALGYLVNTAGHYVSGIGHHRVCPRVVRIRAASPEDLQGLEPWWEVDRGWACSTLLSALYVQFLDFICQKRSAALCAQCGRWFTIKRVGGEFCSAKCRGQHHYQKKRKEALRLHRQGTPVPEIARSLGVDEEKVRKWVRQSH